MSLAAGGRAMGATSTRSSSESWARRSASPIDTTPTCSPSGPTRRTSGTRIRSLMRGSVMASPLLMPGRSRWATGRRNDEGPGSRSSRGPLSGAARALDGYVRDAVTDRCGRLSRSGDLNAWDGVRWERAPLGQRLRGATVRYACPDGTPRHTNATARPPRGSFRVQQGRWRGVLRPPRGVQGTQRLDRPHGALLVGGLHGEAGDLVVVLQLQRRPGR